MRILYVTYEGRMAGAEQSLLLLLRHLRGCIEPVVACPSGSELMSRCRDQGVTCQSLPPVGRCNALSKARCLRAAIYLRRIIKQVKPDIIHANNFHAMAISSLSRGLYGSRLIWHARDLPKLSLASKWCIGKAERIIAVSKAIKKSFVEIGVSDERIDVVYNGIDPPAHEQASTTAGSGHFTFACVGQLVQWKNQQAYLEAAEVVHRQLPDARLLLVGSDLFDRRDSYEGQLKAMIESRRMSYVQCIGWQKDMKPIWRKTDCLVHTAHMEPFGRVLIEAMAHGRPVIAYASGGPVEIVADGESGLLVPFGDIEALSSAMLQVVTDHDLAAAMGKIARKRAAGLFSAERTAEGVMAIYRRLLQVT